MFHIEDSVNDDRFYIENCWFSEFANFLTCENVNSVSWTIFKTTMTSRYPGAIWYDFTGDYSGGFLILGGEVLVKGNESILFRTSGATAGVGIGDISMKDSRFEATGVGTDTYTVVLAQWGKFFFENINFDYAGSDGVNSVLSYLSHPATVHCKDCVLPGTIKIKTRLASDYNALTNVKTQLTTENCEWISSIPNWVFVKDTDESEQTFMAMLADARSFRPIQIINTQSGSAYVSNMFFDTSANQQGGIDCEQTIVFHRIGTDGYPYINSVNMFLPLGSIITSIVVHCGVTDTGVIDGIKVSIGDWNATAALSNSVSTKAELVGATQSGVAIPLANDVQNKISAVYTKTGSPVGDATPAYVVLKYRALRGLFEKPATSVATMIGT
jgi:hypothetical protein